MRFSLKKKSYNLPKEGRCYRLVQFYLSNFSENLNVLLEVSGNDFWDQQLRPFNKTRTPLQHVTTSRSTYCKLYRPRSPIPRKSVLGSSPWKPISHHCLEMRDSNGVLGFKNFHNWRQKKKKNILLIFTHKYPFL